ncbi:MAG TPA: UvrD-helicase domain-containing protein [Opitutaceae bacterium]|jgi:ATP-dependent helicase/nuclease subunit A|nr:UvrD-helicase domain-containing protein [Opitutaceae bacterium]
MSAPRHVMILASAGSGKTYALTNRFVQLLAYGARPERIVALTFTRKAAGEFFDEILNKLAAAARDAGSARQLADEIGQPQLVMADFLKMLRAVTDAMHRLRLGTLDSFFAHIARAFPLELGLAGEFEILQEHAARLERQRVLRQMFTRAGGLDAAQKEFIEAFKRATFGAEEKRLGALLDAFIDEHQEIYLAAPNGELWGNPARIWPDGNPWLNPRRKLDDAVKALGDSIARRGLSGKQQARWDDFFAALPGVTPGVLPGAVEYILKNALAVWPELEAGRAEMTVERKKLALASDECRALADIVTHLVGGELARRLETTRGIFAVLRGYEAFYHDAVRRAGRLTFADVQRLLTPGEGARPLTREADAADRLFIDYRLDAEIDHWLLDEFQDTSFGQWSVLRNLIDEAVQDEAGGRSFFCVGDVKQAIFSWREGDPRLFREVFNHYNHAAPGTIAEEHLVSSWRSGPALIEMVNTVFGASEVLAGLFPGEASEAWNREWRDHVSAVPQRTGQAAWLQADGEEGRFALALKLLQEIRPLDRGLTCAVLVQTNATATALADFLRREGGLPAVAESDLHVCTDNPLGAALLALVQAAAHPGDTLAWEHLRMTPVGALLAGEKLDVPAALTERVLGQIHAEGFERTMEAWLKKIEPRLAPDDVFSRERARQFAVAAGLFDATGRRDVAEFVQFMERHAVRDTESAAAVRVMTIHKSKGLGFDVVLLPDLEGKKLDQRRDGLAVQKGADRSVEWVFDLPNEIFREHDPVLAMHVRAAEAESCYEKLSLLYVAMTRAKRAMYVITGPVGASKSRNFPRVLADALGAGAGPVRVGTLTLDGAWSAGDAGWFAQLPAPKEERETAGGITMIDAAGSIRAPRWPARRPSAEKTGLVGAASVFALEGAGAVDFGVEVHRMLAGVEWAAAKEIEHFAAAWAGRGVAGDEALACLRAPELAAVWGRRNRAKVWRERAFEVVLDGAWVTGVFDRVIIELDEAGRAVRATVFDFKTDRMVGDADGSAMVDRHARQLNLYRRVLAVLAGLDASVVACELVLTRWRRLVNVPPPRV